VSSNKKRKNLALKKSLKKTIKKSYPDDWKQIVKCIEDAIDMGLEGDALEAQIDQCLQNITSVSDLERDHLKKTPRSHITVGGG